MNIIIAGGRSFNNYKLLKYKILEIIKGIQERITIIQGEASSGADQLAKHFAKERGFNMRPFPADWDNLNAPGAVIKTNNHGKKYNAMAGFDRNRKMAENSEMLIAFWDGKSPGTRNMIETAKDLGLIVHIVKY